VIADMLARLEEPANHGRVLVERALGYLRAARHGLAEDEVLQVLSADEEVMANFRERSPFSPEVAGLPAVIWSRLCLDLRPYLAERAADGTSLLSFYHRQVGAVVGERYLGDEGARLEAHRRLEKYFRGQPSWLVTQGAERATNLRKASELVTQQVGGECWDQVEGTLTELEFLEAKVEAGLAFDLAMDFTRCNRALPQDRTWARNLRLLEQALRNDLYFIVLRPLTLFQCFWNSAWWYDSPSAAGHHDPPEDGWGEPGPPWEQPEPKLCTLLERWREGKEARQPGFCWVRSLRPPRFALGGPHVSCMRGHGAEVTGVAFAPDELTVASGSSDGTIRLWSVANGMETACLRTHSPRGQSVAFSPDGARIASGAWDENVRVWDAATGEELACLRSHRSTGLSVAFSPDGTRLASGSSDGTARVWDTSTGEEVACMFGHEGVVRSVAFSPDGARLASGSDDRTVRAWDAATGEEVACMRGHERHVWSLAFSPDGARIVSGSEDGTVRVWDARAGAETACLCAQNAAVHSVALSPDGAWIASGSSDNAVRVWDAATGVELACLRGHEDEVRSVAWSSDARLVSGSDDGTVRLWAWEAAETSGRLRGEGREVTCWALSPDGSCVASGSSDGTLTLWDADSGEQLSVFVEDCPTKYADWRHVERVAWAPTGLRIASGDRDGFIRLWDAHTGLQLTSDCCHNGWVTSLSWSADGEEVFSGSDDGTVRIWDAGCLECLGVDESQDFVGVPQGSDRVDPGHVGPAAGLKLQIRETGVDIAWFPPYLPRLSAQPTRAVWTGGVADYLAIFALEGDPDAANA
jgi:WD40 repeat protein